MFHELFTVGPCWRVSNWTSCISGIKLIFHKADPYERSRASYRGKKLNLYWGLWWIEG